ncbi:MAG: sodium:solute symporter family protein [Planctomycetota bacterium]
MSDVDWIIVGFYIVLVWAIGFWLSRRATRSTAEFFASGRGLPWWLIGTSMAASAFSSDTPHYVARLARESGVARNWEWWGVGIGGVLVAFIIAPLWRRVGVLTDLELIELRYGGKAAAALRGFRAVHTGLLFNVLTMAAPLAGMLLVVEAVVPEFPVQALQFELGTALVLATVLYSFFGGFWGVVVTDFLQFVIAMVAAVVLAVVAVDHAGGLDRVLEVAARNVELQAFDFSVSSPDPWTEGLLPFLVFALVQWWAFMNADGGGKLVQRMVAAKNERHAVWGTLWFNVTHYALRTWPWVIVGLSSLVLLPDIEPRLAYAGTAAHVLPAGLLGLFVASFVAAYMSTVDTQLNWGSSYLVHDLYRRFLVRGRTESHYVGVARLFTLLLGLGAVGMLALGDKEGGVTQYLRLAMRIGSGYGIALLARWFWWRATAVSEIVALATAFAVTVAYHPRIGLMPAGHAYALKLLVTAGITGAAWLLSVLLLRVRAPDGLVDFYRRARPPGWWGPVAALAPDVQRRRLDGWRAGVCGLLLVFGLTLGLGGWLLGAAGTGVWAWLAVAAAGGLGVAFSARGIGPQQGVAGP